MARSGPESCCMIHRDQAAVIRFVQPMDATTPTIYAQPFYLAANGMHPVTCSRAGDVVSYQS